jgi:glycosyltransferase involved in cell wall biosynthesis
MSKKVLIICYYWIPAGGPGVQRWLKFVKYLPSFGYQPIVYIPENPNYPIIDNEIENEVPKEAIILKHKIFEPYQLAAKFSKKDSKTISSGIIAPEKQQSFVQKILLWIRGNIFIPDARMFWIKPSVQYLQKYIIDNQIDTIITSGPPHSLHLIGLQLKEKLNIRWLADFRDPWTTISYHKALKLSAFAAKKHKKLEQKVLQSADKLIVTSHTTKKEFESQTKKPITVITNGYDTVLMPKVVLDTKFSMAHIGSLLAERNPKILWQVLQELCLEIKGFQDDFQLNLTGKVSQNILDTLQEFQLMENTQVLGYISHQEAIKHQKKSQILLLIEIDSKDTECIIPGKLFEYMVSNRPIIAIGPEKSDIQEIILKTNTGVYFNYQENERLKNQILEYYIDYKNGKLKAHGIGLQYYSRENLTKQLVDVLKK